MMSRIDRALDGTTMYRLALYVLAAYVALAAILAGFGLLPFAPLALLGSATFLVLICWAANSVLRRVLGVPANLESAAITGLILALILDPAQSLNDLQILFWAAILAMSSKYILTLRNTHIFNPAALAAVVISFALGRSASWWVGTATMLPIVVLGGLLIVRKLRDASMVASFLAAALVTVGLVTVVLHLSISGELQQLLVESPLFFFGSIMLTEPVTAPATRTLKALYGALVGVLIIPQIHIGTLYSTPELALLVGNLASFAASPKRTMLLQVKKKSKLSPDTLAFVFKPSHKPAFTPGQYVELTIDHPRADSRGNRRYFTLASSPTEELVQLGVRFNKPGSSFKRALRAMSTGARITASHIAGDFTLPPDPRQKLVFIAGGIGITPFRSMLKYLLDTQQRRDIVLLYTNRTPADIVYRDVLGEAQAKLGVKIIYTLTEAVPRDWTGSTGRIDAQMIRKAVPDYRERVFYLSGPPTMVREHERMLRALGIGRNRIKKDSFAGLS